MYETFDYDKVVGKMRLFFREKGFVEVPTQSRLSILAACEDPKTISQFVFDGINYPLPQTGQMWLEYEMLKNPELEGVYCVSTSYRNEPNPIEGRHQKIFPMFEFESKGDMNTLIATEEELLDYLGFKKDSVHCTYDGLCERYEVEHLEADHETRMCKEISTKLFLKFFPQRSHPFWNMKQNHKDKNLYNKVDVILHGQETIGSAERSCNPHEMYENFLSISGGQYANLLYKQFTEARVMKELDDYLNLDFFPRFGAGIGVNRMARAMKLEGLLG
jgi:aspartyl/asparaginyl-tRNA synthetase